MNSVCYPGELKALCIPLILCGLFDESLHHSLRRYRSKPSSGSSSIVTIPQDTDSGGDPGFSECRSSSMSLSSADSQDYPKMQHNDSTENDSTNGNSSPLNMNQDSNSSIELLPDPTPPVNTSPVTKR